MTQVTADATTHTEPACFSLLGPNADDTLAATFRVVAVRRHPTPNWCAYFGPATWSDEDILRKGYKLSLNAAKFDLFPNIRGVYDE